MDKPTTTQIKQARREAGLTQTQAALGIRFLHVRISHMKALQPTGATRINVSFIERFVLRRPFFIPKHSN
jgi:hypothetical protein